ncbi:MAG: relaxase/mobilization nuclease domain-containing protein [Ruminococcus sp.]|nr:relaxase/mobilization nuclease domain-containing protein [Ruminococcus sp.]
MATTGIHSIKSTLHKAIEYIINPEKTNGGDLVSYVGCFGDQFLCEKEFLDVRELGTKRGTILAQHLHQSFKPGEVTSEQAHLLGIQLADELLGGEYQYIIATHVDKDHIHNHIIFNNIGYNHLLSFEYRDNRGGKVFEKIQKINDKICRDNNLSVVENPELGTGKSHHEWFANKDGSSWKAKLKYAIDNIIMESVSFEDFLSKCKQNNIEYDYHPEHTIKLKFRLPGQTRFCRARTLGWWYDEPQLRRRIEQYQMMKRQSERGRNTHFIDTTKGKFQKEIYLKRWADIQNMKEASRLINELETMSVSKYGYRVQLVAELNNIQNNIDELSKTIKMIELYQEYKPYHDEHKKARNKKKYEKENADALKKYDSIRQRLLREFPNKVLPNIEQLYDDRQEFIERRNELNIQYKDEVSQLQEIEDIRLKIQDYLNGNGKIQEKKKGLE